MKELLNLSQKDLMIYQYERLHEAYAKKKKRLRSEGIEKEKLSIAKKMMQYNELLIR